MLLSLAVLGAVLVAAAIVGGRFRAAGVEVPLISSRPREFLLAGFGLALLAIGLASTYVSGEGGGGGNAAKSETTATDTESQQTEPAATPTTLTASTTSAPETNLAATSQAIPATTSSNVPSSTLAESLPGTVSERRCAIATVLISGFEVCVEAGEMTADGLSLSVSETSIDYKGVWTSWRTVLAGTFLMDTDGKSFQPWLEDSVGWTDGPVQPGDARTGQIVFRDVRYGLPRMYLNFDLAPAWISPLEVGFDIEYAGQAPEIEEEPTLSLAEPACVIAKVIRAYEVCVVDAELDQRTLVLIVRESSVDYSGAWTLWRTVLKGTILEDDAGKSYQPYISESAGWNNGDVAPGESREGSIVFHEVSKGGRMTLHFDFAPAWVGPVAIPFDLLE